MEGIVFQNIDKEKFEALFNKVHQINETLSLLVDKENSEKISPEMAAEELDVTTQTIYSYIRKGILPASKVGRKLLIKRSDISQALKEVKSLKYHRK
ncbi:helix-turn-helix domain-containing protein [Winogradskyella tangerina]|uniref:helix-turn-helix domain-containing protein n=1 Tax=Winogradskyella tangerina TaxID=2023240 RepID=UPI000DBE8FA2|nr:helix-turn-helix domain-containing protein [Winogradskyella tangerina]